MTLTSDLVFRIIMSGAYLLYYATDDSFTEYLKQTTEKTQGTKEKRNASPKPGKSNSSHSGPALKGATLEMIKKDEEKKKKDEKDKLKKQQKEERKQQWQKEQA